MGESGRGGSENNEVAAGRYNIAEQMTTNGAVIGFGHIVRRGMGVGAASIHKAKARKKKGKEKGCNTNPA